MLKNKDLDFEAIPLFDLNEMNSAETLQKLVIRLRDICHHVGFFYVKNHGVDPALLSRMLYLSEVFFDLSDQEKEAISILLSPHYRGYGKLMAEMTDGIPDFKETYDLGLEQSVQPIKENQRYKILQGPNQWPHVKTLQILQWKETVLQYISALQQLGLRLMQMMSMALDLPKDYLASFFSAHSDDSYAILRMLRYPPGRRPEGSDEPLLGVGPHVDAGCLVILLQDEVGGLQVQNCSGQWIDAPPIADTFVVNIGEMLQIWSNNYFLATPHRVINSSTHIRHSVPFFFEPNLSTVVSPFSLSDKLLAEMKRPMANPATNIVYGEHILKIYERSFPR
ncbi:MAG: 2-oxoglutarate and iron-dependent oxygenase domain-containing protein [Gammaproteobacteria bacterium]|nr:2-oxoglutarate and iron-dependent oxygenase domain-containing protein [Gammaproteobacteria bacterium]